MKNVALLLGLWLLIFGACGCDKARSDSVRLTNQGMRALNKGDIREARIRFADAINVFEDNANAHYGLGVVLIELGDPKRAERHLLQASRLKPELTEAVYHLGAIAFRDGRLDEAAQHLTKCLQQDPDHAAAYGLMGQIYERKGALDKADVAFRRAIGLDPLEPSNFLALGRLYLRVDAQEEAMAVLREGLRINTPDRVRTTESLSLLHNELGIMLQQQGQYGKAVDELLEAVRLPGAQPPVVFNLGWAYASKGDSKMALRYFNQFIGLADNSDPTARIAQEVAGHLTARLARERGADKTL